MAEDGLVQSSIGYEPEGIVHLMLDHAFQSCISLQVSLLESDKIRLMDAVEHVTGHPLGHVADPIPADIRRQHAIGTSPSRASRQLQKSSTGDDTMTKTVYSIMRMICPHDAKGQVGICSSAVHSAVYIRCFGYNTI